MEHESPDLTPTENEDKAPEDIPDPLNPRENVKKNSFFALDGSKLILTLGKGEKFWIDWELQLSFHTKDVLFEKFGGNITLGTCSGEDNSVVITSNRRYKRFIPIYLEKYSPVYTAKNIQHVVVGRNIKRVTVIGRNFPTRNCTRFSAGKDSSEGRRNHPPTVFIRTDESIIRYSLAKEEKIELDSAEVVAWTRGVRFSLEMCCCFRSKVRFVTGEGTVWLTTPVKFGNV